MGDPAHKAHQPVRLLEELSGLAARARAGEPLSAPRVTLHLVSGRDVRGRLLELSDDVGVRVALIARETDDRFSLDVTHVPITHLEAITVHDVSRLGQPSTEIKVPSKLELRRMVVALNERLSVGFTLELESELKDADLEPISSALSSLEQALRAILSAELGREAFSSVQLVRVLARNDAFVNRNGDRLEIHVARNFTARPDARGWQEQLERLL
jgi:hypothetical protein